jgi:signal transduction histidine kinase
VFLFNQKGKVLAGANQPLDAQAGLRLYQTELKRLKVNETFHSLPFKAADGQWYFWNFLRMNKHFFLGVRERSARLAELDSLARLFWSIGVLGVFLVLLAGWFIGRSISRPIDKLVAFSAEIGSGKMHSKPPESIRGEPALLKDALLKMRDDLMAHQQEKEHMLAQIAHELRNPLGGIALLAGLIKEDPSVNDVNKAYAQSITDETERLKNQISAYLNYGRPPQPEPAPIDLRTFFADLVKEFESRPDTAHIRFKMQIQEGTIQFDPTHLRQIIRNLLENSVRACGAKGNIEIGALNQELYVRDDGPGIPAEILEKIFNPFFTTDPNGTGLGLAVCRKLCRENNMELTVVNNKNRGCTFTIRRQTSV